MKILALDPATHCGWAYSMDGVGASGTWDLSVRRDESSGMRLVRLVGKLNGLHESATGPLDLLVFEAARHAGPKMQGALVVQAEIQGVIKQWCESKRIQYRGYSPSEIKKHATGKGNANKEKMMEAARANWPDRAIGDDNEADALWILDFAQKEVGL